MNSELFVDFEKGKVYREYRNVVKEVGSKGTNEFIKFVYKNKKYYVHKFVYMTYHALDAIPEGMYVDFVDKNFLNCSINNLILRKVEDKLFFRQRLIRQCVSDVSGRRGRPRQQPAKLTEELQAQINSRYIDKCSDFCDIANHDTNLKSRK